MIDNFSRRILSWRVTDRFDPGATLAVLTEASAAAESRESPPTLVADAGVENVNANVEELAQSGAFCRRLALTEIGFSNSMIESWWRVLKHQWLFLHTLESTECVERLVSFYVREHNTQLPHSAFEGETPDEMYCGTGEGVQGALDARRKEARAARLEKNRATTCRACEGVLGS